MKKSTHLSTSSLFLSTILSTKAEVRYKHSLLWLAAHGYSHINTLYYYPYYLINTNKVYSQIEEKVLWK